MGAFPRSAAFFRVVGAAIVLILPCGAPGVAQSALSVSVLGSPNDSRVAAVREAVAFWNLELERMGAGVRLGPVRVMDGSLPDRVLRELSESQRLLNGPDVEALVDSIPGDVVVALSGADLVSFGVPWSRGSKGFVALRSADGKPLSLPNVARNTVAHELGHVLGLEHNADADTLMCGRPAPCRPGRYASETERFFRLTASDERRLRALWR